MHTYNYSAMRHTAKPRCLVLITDLLQLVSSFLELLLDPLHLLLHGPPHFFWPRKVNRKRLLKCLCTGSFRENRGCMRSKVRRRYGTYCGYYRAAKIGILVIRSRRCGLLKSNGPIYSLIYTHKSVSWGGHSDLATTHTNKVILNLLPDDFSGKTTLHWLDHTEKVTC